jgi:hypothetical protein
VATCADLVVERAVDFVLLRAEDGGEVVGHGRSYDVCAWVGVWVCTVCEYLEKVAIGKRDGRRVFMEWRTSWS